MARQRKTPMASGAIPLASPAKDTPGSQKPLIELSEGEQWRLVRESGVLNKLSGSREALDAFVEPETLSLSDEIFNAILLIIPFSSLLFLMEILIRHQYGKEASIEVILDRMVPGVPILSIFIFYSNRYKHYRRAQFFLFILSTLVGGRMLYQLNHANWISNMKQCPPLATIWIYTIIQLELGPAVLSLLTVASFVWYKDLKIFL